MAKLTDNEILVLKYLTEDQDHEKAPEGLTTAQYSAVAKSLKDKGMVYAAFIDGGEVCGLKIKAVGKAALDDLEQEKNKKKAEEDMKELEKPEYLILGILFKNNGEISFSLKDIKQLYSYDYHLCSYTDDELKKAFMDMSRKKWITINYVADGCFINLQDPGKIALRKKEERANVQHEEEEPPTSGLTIAPKKKTHVVKILRAMAEMGYFQEDGHKASVKSVMEAFSKALKDKEINDYHQLLNRAKESKEKSFLTPFRALYEKAKEIYENRKD